MTPPDGQTGPEVPANIGNVPIVPTAEGNAPPAAGDAAAKRERDFYQQSGEDYKLLQRQQDLGLIGKLIGGGSSAAVNIAAVVAFGAMLFIAASFYMTASAELTNERAWAGGIVGTVLGYLFGSRSAAPPS